MELYKNDYKINWKKSQVINHYVWKLHKLSMHFPLHPKVMGRVFK